MILTGNKLFAYVLAAVFPRFCVICGAEGSLLCRACQLSWEHAPPSAGEGHLAIFAYANPTVRQLICAWKYDYDLSAFEILMAETKELWPELKAEFQKLGVQAIAPLPLSPKRLRERGFNQARMLSEHLGRELDLPVLDLLARTHRSGHQAERSDAERLIAMQASPFILASGVSVPPRVLLVDDVWTTGATLRAAKQVLESTGNCQVFTFTLAKS